MIRPELRFSRGGAIAAGLFLAVFITALGWIFFVASKNPADSGESAILLIFFALPWISIPPTSWIGPGYALTCVLFNALILYCVFGGLRFRRHTDRR